MFYSTLPAISTWSLSPWNFMMKVVCFLVFPCLLLVYTVVLDWNRILGFFFFWAGSWSRQTQSRLTSSPLRFPRRFAVCVNTLFLPSSSSLPARWWPGILSYSTHGNIGAPKALWLTDIITPLGRMTPSRTACNSHSSLKEFLVANYPMTFFGSHVLVDFIMQLCKCTTKRVNKNTQTTLINYKGCRSIH